MARADTTVDTIVFDVGGVLLAHDNDLMFRTLAGRCDRADAEDYLRNRSFGLATGARTSSSVHEELARELGYSGDWPTFKSDICCHFTIDPSMVRLAERLAAHNHVLLFSNTFDIHWEYVLELEDRTIDRFEWYASHIIRDEKPNLSAFNKVAALAEINPARSIFVDDLAANVEGARQAGFIAHQFTDQPSLEQFLRERGITWNE